MAHRELDYFPESFYLFFHSAYLFVCDAGLSVTCDLRHYSESCRLLNSRNDLWYYTLNVKVHLIAQNDYRDFIALIEGITFEPMFDKITKFLVYCNIAIA